MPRVGTPEHSRTHNESRDFAEATENVPCSPRSVRLCKSREYSSTSQSRDQACCPPLFRVAPERLRPHQPVNCQRLRRQQSSVVNVAFSKNPEERSLPAQ